MENGLESQPLRHQPSPLLCVSYLWATADRHYADGVSLPLLPIFITPCFCRKLQS